MSGICRIREFGDKMVYEVSCESMAPFLRLTHFISLDKIQMYEILEDTEYDWIVRNEAFPECVSTLLSRRESWSYGINQ